MEYNLEFIQKNLQIKYLNNLVNGGHKLHINVDKINELLIKLDDTVNEYTVTENIAISQNNSQTDFQKQVDTIDYLYLKPWTKLTLIHKIIKIKEFVNNLEIKDETEKDNLKDTLIELIKDKSIKNKVNYDETKGKITSIPKLAFQNSQYTIV
jgi:hypothetical protein|uniref:Uncharacterized protein n=1 Tax=viral metagenome TaxID=1070528 RepID=A0A6C0D949_9ZZZZ